MQHLLNILGLETARWQVQHKRRACSSIPLSIIHTKVLQRASLALGAARVANGPPMLDEVEMQAIVEAGRDKRGEQLVRLFDSRVLRNPAEPARDAENVRVDRKRRKYGLQLYGIWSTRLEIGSNRLDRWTLMFSEKGRAMDALPFHLSILW